MTVQDEAIAHEEGHARLIAGPGTGKTRAIIEHAAYLVRTGGVSHDRIKVLTFTDAAGKELRDRLSEFHPPLQGIPDAGTLHSYAFRELRKRSGSEYVGRNILSQWEVRNLLCEDLGHAISRSGAQVSNILNEYDAAWRTLTELRPDAFRSSFETELEKLRTVFDFALLGELVYKYMKLMNSDPAYSPDLDYLLVDEYQDLNPCDLSVIREIGRRCSANFYVAGDDDQCIYHFRHADPSGIRLFPEEYENATSYILDICYRCGSPILEPALRLMGHEEGRIEKPIRCIRGDGELHVYSFPSIQQEHRGVGEIIQRHVMEGVNLNNILVLIPRRSFAESYTKSLIEAGIPAINMANPEDILNDDVRKLLYALRFALQEDDPIAARGWLHLTRGIGPGTVATLIGEALQNSIPFLEACRNSSSNRVRSSIEDLEGFANLVSEESAFEEILTDIENDENIPELEIQKLKTIAAELHLPDARPDELREAVQDMEEGGEQLPEATIERIRVTTFRKAKGLTADVVIVTDLDDDIVPADEPDISEQRRLFYVTMTRAREFLYLAHVTTRFGRTRYAGAGHRAPGPYRQRSRFLDEIGVRSESYGDDD